MRTNLPVTSNEIELKDTTLIVSRTDLQGRITYINKDFLDISGFTEAELIGEPHNLVRHPDMPAEAFEDLWRDLKAGRPWVGYVKNRCKNGDFYWVEAHAAPIWENGQVVGYMSVRRKPVRATVTVVDAAYRKFREGKAGGLRIAHGGVIGTGPVARLRKGIKDMSISGKLILGCLAAVILVLAVGEPLMNTKITAELNRSSESNLTVNVGLIRNMLEMRLGSLKNEAVQLNNAFDSLFREGFVLDGEADTPVLRHGKSDVINGNFEVVDTFTKRTGAVATLFVAKDDDFLRVTTSLKKETGERAVGTPLGKTHPAYATVTSGKPYVGRARLFGKDYYTSYTPIVGKSGKVIGLSFVGLDITTALATLKDTVRALKVGETGYYYVLDANAGKDYGNLVIHPAKEGTNLLASKDADGREFIKEMLEKKQGTMHYQWMNAELGDKTPRDKIVVFDTLPEAKWLVAGGTYADEFEILSRQVGWYAIGGGIAIALALMALVYAMVRRLVVQPLESAVLPAFRALSAGRYDSPLDVSGSDEMAQVRQGLETMQNRLGFEVAESKRQNDEMTRIKIALDNVSTGVMIANSERTIIYTNRAVVKVLKNAEPAIRTQLANFSADNLVGQSIDQFHKNPKHQADLLGGMTSTYSAKVEIGGCHMVVVANPVINDKGERLGAVAEWLDRTTEVNTELEVAALVAAAASGDLSQRMDINGKDGFFASLGGGLNQLLGVTQQALETTSEALGRVARGDLTRTIDENFTGIFGQLKDDTNTTVERLREVVGRIKEATEAINTASQEIAAGNTDLSSRTEEQASSLEETASSMEELNATVKANAENARQGKELSQKSNDAVVRGGQMVKQVVTTMSGIQESSKKIADIIGVIDSIAFQTNILALNAAVEAARAGEQGRGFAVVATEVRNLAQRSATAAKEIKMLIAESVDQVENGAKLVHQAGDTMDEVVVSFQQVASLVTEIANASKEQSSGIEQVTQAVGQMDEVTQQNAALVEQAAAAAESLEEQARGLVQSVGMFTLVDGPRGKSNLPGPALRDATPRRLTGAGGKVGVGGTAPRPGRTTGNTAANANKSAGKQAPPHLASEDEEWEEF